MPEIQLTDEELDLLQQALDSHKYWQLSDQNYRSEGYVLDRGSDDPDNVAAIAACDELAAKLAVKSSRRS